MPKLKPGTIWPTDEEDAEITAAALTDPDNPPWSDEDLARMRPSTRFIGRPKLEHPKLRLTMRVDAEVLAAFKALGAGWQTQINDLLREVVASGVLNPPKSTSKSKSKPKPVATATRQPARATSAARVVEDLEKKGRQVAHAR